MRALAKLRDDLEDQLKQLRSWADSEIKQRDETNGNIPFFVELCIYTFFLKRTNHFNSLVIVLFSFLSPLLFPLSSSLLLFPFL